jgi:predicted MFS family arabinose efflux permease
VELLLAVGDVLAHRRGAREQKHAMGIGVQSVIKRLPIIIGPICGGVLVDRFGIVPGVRIALAITIVLGIVTIFPQRRLARYLSVHGAK